MENEIPLRHTADVAKAIVCGPEVSSAQPMKPGAPKRRNFAAVFAIPIAFLIVIGLCSAYYFAMRRNFDPQTAALVGEMFGGFSAGAALLAFAAAALAYSLQYEQFKHQREQIEQQQIQIDEQREITQQHIRLLALNAKLRSLIHMQSYNNEQAARPDIEETKRKQHQGWASANFSDIQKVNQTIDELLRRLTDEPASNINPRNAPWNIG